MERVYSYKAPGAGAHTGPNASNDPTLTMQVET